MDGNRQMANKIAKGWEVDPPYKYPFQVSISGEAVKDVTYLVVKGLEKIIL